jgi:hypothetical protein
MRAPHRLSGALARTRELLARDRAHRTAHEGEVHHRELAGEVLDLGAADHHRVAEAGRDLRFGEPVLVGAQVEEAERIGGAQVGGLLREAPLVGKLSDPCTRLDGEVMTALLAHAQGRVELVVAVVRAATRAGVGVLLGRRLRRVLVLDGDVNPARLGHA